MNQVLNATATLICMSLVLALWCGCGASGIRVGAKGAGAPKLVDSVVRDERGVLLAEEYKGERMRSTSAWANAVGTKVSTIYCGRYSTDALVYARVYAKGGEIIRTERITGDDPMALTLEVLDPSKGMRTRCGTITQGESRLYFERFVCQEGLVLARPPPP